MTHCTDLFQPGTCIKTTRVLAAGTKDEVPAGAEGRVERWSTLHMGLITVNLGRYGIWGVEHDDIDIIVVE